MNCPVCDVGAGPEMGFCCLGPYAEIYDVLEGLTFPCDACNKKWVESTGIILDQPWMQQAFDGWIMAADAVTDMVEGGFITFEQAKAGFDWYVKQSFDHIIEAYREAIGPETAATLDDIVRKLFNAPGFALDYWPAATYGEPCVEWEGPMGCYTRVTLSPNEAAILEAVLVK